MSSARRLRVENDPAIALAVYAVSTLSGRNQRRLDALVETINRQWIDVAIDEGRETYRTRTTTRNFNRRRVIEDK